MIGFPDKKKDLSHTKPTLTDINNFDERKTQFYLRIIKIEEKDSNIIDGNVL